MSFFLPILYDQRRNKQHESSSSAQDVRGRERRKFTDSWTALRIYFPCRLHRPYLSAEQLRSKIFTVRGSWAFGNWIARDSFADLIQNMQNLRSTTPNESSIASVWVLLAPTRTFQHQTWVLKHQTWVSQHPTEATLPQDLKTESSMAFHCSKLVLFYFFRPSAAYIISREASSSPPVSSEFI